ncbi:MAG TPA: pyridoxamine 5'-phosphate oxidase family protein [Kofleriaceae bacterium]|nr:pyridoxamine 5'-phosphate oxidase family protein [Kofleriaceae bacterium]
MKPSTDVAFTEAVKAEQAKRGSRAAYARVEARGGWPTAITRDLADFLATAQHAFLATASADGQPYVQHRGGPPGFLRVVDERTIAFEDFEGNKQYISIGNLAENPRVCLFVADFDEKRRVKIWGTARVIENAERAIVISVSAWSENCPQYL